MEELPLPLHMIYIMIKPGIFSFGRSKSLVSAEAASQLHLAYLNDTRQVSCCLDNSSILDTAISRGSEINTTGCLTT